MTAPTFTMAQLAAEAGREVRLRNRVYIKDGGLTPLQNRRIRIMRDISALLHNEAMLDESDTPLEWRAEFTASQLAAEARREANMRERVYGRHGWTAARRRQLAMMERIASHFEALAANDDDRRQMELPL